MAAPTCPDGYSQFFLADPPDPATGCDYVCRNDSPPFDLITPTCADEPTDCYIIANCECTATDCTDQGKLCCKSLGSGQAGCVSVTYPECSAELSCVWNSLSCDFDCQNPNCPPGMRWEDAPLCRCVPECTGGQVYCAATGKCIDPPPLPQCGEWRECEWIPESCEWRCGPIECPCPTNWTWDTDWCMCVPPNEFPPLTDCCRCTAVHAGDPLGDPERACAEFEHSISPWNICPRLYRTSSDESVRGVRVERHCYQSGAYPPPNNWVCGTCPPGWWACGGGGTFACPGATFMCVHPLGWLRSKHAVGKCLEFGAEPECALNQPWSSSHPYWCECSGTEDGLDDLGGKEPCNLENSVGQYYSAWRDESRIRFNRAETTTPPYDLTGIIAEPPTGYVYGEPTFVQDWRHRHILLFSKLETATPTNISVLEIVSDDDGKTWSTPTTVFTGARKPRISINPSNGAVLRAAYLPGSPATVGTLKASVQYPGDAAPGTEFTIKEYVGAALIDLRVKDEGFHIAPAADGPGRWLLICTREAESSPADLQSWDECKTFTAANA